MRETATEREGGEGEGGREGERETETERDRDKERENFRHAQSTCIRTYTINTSMCWEVIFS